MHREHHSDLKGSGQCERESALRDDDVLNLELEMDVLHHLSALRLRSGVK